MADRNVPELFPIFLHLHGRQVLVVGAGPVGARKIEALVRASARVHVVAPSAVEGVREMASAGVLAWSARPFDETDVEGAWLVVAATSDPEVQRRVAVAAGARRQFLLAVDDRDNATAYSGAVIRRAPFTVAISSSGATPALTRLLREVIEHVLPERDWIEHAERLRAQWTASSAPIGGRFGELVRELAARLK